MNHIQTHPSPVLDQEKMLPAMPPAWEAERRAFARLLPSLLGTHPGRYVAVHGGRVIVEGADQIEVARRAYAQVGYVPVYVGLVSEEPARPVRIPSPRLLHKES